MLQDGGCRLILIFDPRDVRKRPSYKIQAFIKLRIFMEWSLTFYASYFKAQKPLG